MCNLDIRDARLQSPSLSDSTDRDWRRPHGRATAAEDVKCWLSCQQGLIDMRQSH